ncbi:hypothetical protein BK816_07535 [Boudabousia tangfeifanii]|uniref:SLH domain-containing protein n=1 Tax=Boudabousia tangfeifanii TaxID=1912795 RepID=A0A1D9MLI7_9ACTO|nr:S-layer homology domain-containing protein [Boudabousia tangfeifanii]AOZ73162.1 hypothetical protein BK816_07535 [Boudabousia tangfeifanii]
MNRTITRSLFTTFSTLAVVGSVLVATPPTARADYDDWDGWGSQCTRSRFNAEKNSFAADKYIDTKVSVKLTKDPGSKAPALKNVDVVSGPSTRFCNMGAGGPETRSMQYGKTVTFSDGISTPIFNPYHMASFSLDLPGQKATNTKEGWVLTKGQCSDGKKTFELEEQSLTRSLENKNRSQYLARYVAPKGVTKPLKCNVELRWARPAGMIIRSEFGNKDQHVYHFEAVDPGNGASLDTTTRNTRGKFIKTGKYLITARGGNPGNVISKWSCTKRFRNGQNRFPVTTVKTRSGWVVDVPSNVEVFCAPEFNRIQPKNVQRVMKAAVPPQLKVSGVTVDVDAKTQFAGEISWLKSNKITTGWHVTKSWDVITKDEKGKVISRVKQSEKATEFRPLLNIERGAMAAFLYRLAGSPKVNVTKAPFKDIPKNHQFAKAITWMKNMDITGGWRDGTFRSDAPVDRNAMAAFLYRFRIKYPSKVSADIISVPLPGTNVRASFKDTGSDFFKPQIEWLAQTKISTGWPDKTFRPTTPIKRDAMAAFLYRLTHNRVK